MRARLKETNGQLRMASLIFEHDDGTYTELVVVGFELDWELAHVDRLIESLRWED